MRFDDKRGQWNNVKKCSGQPICFVLYIGQIFTNKTMQRIVLAMQAICFIIGIATILSNKTEVR